ncbi:MAG TPA: MerR family transcriptional regulator [Anaerolineaceae bacterium]|nr:MerR family transcriptional regulator [Anaerolineaceae bacterium]
MNQDKYWISDLAAVADVSRRTIRYYIQEGLLPQPKIRGKYAEFTETYIHRLRLIKVLKDAYLPLNRIRDVLNALKDEQVVPLLEEFERDPVSALSGLQALPVFDQSQSAAENVSGPASESALDYINNLRMHRKKINESNPPSIVNFQRAYAPAQPVTVEWQRIKLAHGLELHVRQPVRPHIQQLVDQVIEMVQQQNPSTHLGREK